MKLVFILATWTYKSRFPQSLKLEESVDNSVTLIDIHLCLGWLRFALIHSELEICLPQASQERWVDVMEAQVPVLGWGQKYMVSTHTLTFPVGQTPTTLGETSPGNSSLLALPPFPSASFASLLVSLGNTSLVHQFSSVQFSLSVVSDSLQPHKSQHTRPPCPSPTPGVHSNARPSSRWCHPAISSSVVPFSSCPQSLPALVSSSESTLHIGGQSIGVSALASFLPKNTQDWFPCSPRDSQESSPTPQFKSINSSVLSFLHSPTLTSIHDHWKNHSLDYMDLSTSLTYK